MPPDPFCHRCHQAFQEGDVLVAVERWVSWKMDVAAELVPNPAQRVYMHLSCVKDLP